uniref:Uncharacterized protein n=1 Tax=Cajanus cajan TaxID=3821 RepID=A0A151S0Z6_CAJCA|nr:hypothetical protein KK1_029868 [Cajanus cajan]
MEDRIGADDCGSRESNVSTRTSINSGASSISISPPGDSGRSEAEKAFLQQMMSSDAASEYSPARISTCRSSWISKYLSACNLLAPVLQSWLLSCIILPQKDEKQAYILNKINEFITKKHTIQSQFI